MQLGARWRVGETPHRGVPPVLHAAIAAQEAAHPDAHSWTLTFLEGRARCALDDLVLVALDASGAVAVTDIRQDRSRGGSGPADLVGPAGTATSEDDEDDDDWLS